MSQPIHASQRVLNESADQIEIELEVSLTEELYAFILSQGPRVEVLAPEVLKNEIQSRVARVLERYQ